jgi:hypothetical protein
MHADLFSSERGNTANATVRTALGDLFQRYGVNLVLSGDGDSYERTKALSGNLASPTAAPASDEVATATDGIVFVRAGSGGRTSAMAHPNPRSGRRCATTTAPVPAHDRRRQDARPDRLRHRRARQEDRIDRVSIH